MTDTVSVVQGDVSASLKPRPTVLADGITIDGTWECRTRVLHPDGTLPIDKIITVKTADSMRFVVNLSPAETGALEVETYTWVIELSNPTYTPPFNIEQRYTLAIEPQYQGTGLTGQILLERGVNSFGTYAELLDEMANMPSIPQASGADRMLLKQALLQGWINIGNVSVDFENELYNTRDFTDVVLDALTPAQQSQLRQAQLVEADFVLGGNPIEQRRRMGLMSDSAGESAHFMRPTKPVVLPICRETAFTLAPYLRYVTGAGR